MSRISIAALSLLLISTTISVQCLSAEGEDEGLSPTSKLPDKFSIHGYLSLAYGRSDSYQILGIPEDGTSEYSTAALQIRYTPTDNNNFVLQLSREYLGDSPTNVLRKDIELDWLYYQRLFTDSTSISVGRIPLPLGIYNTIKDVGTLLPFFRPSPMAVYGDGTFTSDTIDGLVFSHRFAHNSPWSLSIDLYYGEWEWIEEPTYEVVEIKDAMGFQLWLYTPLSDARFGIGMNQYDVKGGLYDPLEDGDPVNDIYLSFDGNFGRIVFRMEYLDTSYNLGYWKGYYAELLVNMTEKLRLTTFYEKGKAKFTVPFFAVFEDDWTEDYALGLNYAFRHNLVLKLEHHWHEGFNIENEPVDPFFGKPLRVNYSLLSLSMHF